MTAHLIDSDRQLIEILRYQAGVFADVEDHLLDQGNGVIMVTCSDGDQMPDIFSFQEKMRGDHRKNPRIHTIALNGGALLIGENSPLKSDGEDRVMLKHIKQAIELKGITTIALYVHAPCGAAGLCRLDMRQVLDLLMEAKRRIKTEMPGVTVACFCHVDNGKKRTYFVSRERYEEWKQRQAA